MSTLPLNDKISMPAGLVAGHTVTQNLQFRSSLTVADNVIKPPPDYIDSLYVCGNRKAKRKGHCIPLERLDFRAGEMSMT